VLRLLTALAHDIHGQNRGIIADDFNSLDVVVQRPQVDVATVLERRSLGEPVPQRTVTVRHQMELGRLEPERRLNHEPAGGVGPALRDPQISVDPAGHEPLAPAARLSLAIVIPRFDDDVWCCPDHERLRRVAVIERYLAGSEDARQGPSDQDAAVCGRISALVLCRISATVFR
jgi:hypothetical protein